MNVRKLTLTAILFLSGITLFSCNRNRDLLLDPQKSEAQLECEKKDKEIFSWSVTKNECVEKEQTLECSEDEVLIDGQCASKCDEGEEYVAGICIAECEEGEIRNEDGKCALPDNNCKETETLVDGICTPQRQSTNIQVNPRYVSP